MTVVHSPLASFRRKPKFSLPKVFRTPPCPTVKDRIRWGDGMRWLGKRLQGFS
jgi:hypothetical protein